MDEADLNRHLAKQTGLRAGLVDFVAMKRGKATRQLEHALADGAVIISIDVLDRETLIEAGRLIWELGGDRVFGLGSQGFEAALVAWWQERGLLPMPQEPARAGAAGHIVCVSGSVSPVTAGQIAHALAHGFEGIRLDVTLAVDAAAWKAELNRAAAKALAALGNGRDPLVFTATGPDDPAVAALAGATHTAGLALADVNERIGSGLGYVLNAVIRQAGLRRAVISGGDTSGRAAAMLRYRRIDRHRAARPWLPPMPRARTGGRAGRAGDCAERRPGWSPGLPGRCQAGWPPSLARLSQSKRLTMRTKEENLVG